MGASELPGYDPQLRALEEIRRGEKWARGTLKNLVGSLSGTLKGGRNAALNNAAMTLGHQVAAGYLREEEVVAALQEASLANGYSQEHGRDATIATIRSGLAAGMASPRHPPDRPDEQRPSRGPTIIRPAPVRTSSFFRASAFHGQPIPQREWLAPELIPMRTVTIFGGDGGTGKSLLMLQCSVAAVTAGQWLGREVLAGPALFLTAEDEKDELQRRLADICEAEGSDFRDLGDLVLRSLAGEDALLAMEQPNGLEATALFAELEAMVKEVGAKLVVLDTSADLYPANENDRAKVRQFIGILKGLAIRCNCAVVLLSHPSLSGLSSGSGMSGSTAWNNSARSRLYLERILDGHHETDPNRRRLKTMKSNHGPIGGEILLTWERGIFRADTPALSGVDRRAATAKAERLFLEMLDEFSAQGRDVNAKGASTYAPKQFAEHHKSEGVTKKAFIAAMNKLLSEGKIMIDEKGPPSRRVSFLRRVAT